MRSQSIGADSPKTSPTINPGARNSVNQPKQSDADKSKISLPVRATSISSPSKSDKITTTQSDVFTSKRIPVKTTQERRSMNKKLARLERMKSKLNGIMLARTSPYRPFANRDMSDTNSFFHSLVSLVMSSVGTGLLAMPRAMSNVGYAVGFIMTIIIHCICTHCLHIFVVVSRGVCKIELIPKMGYAETCEACFKNGPEFIQRFSHLAGRFARCALFCTYFGNCCIHTVFIIDSVKQFCDGYFFASPVLTRYYGLAVLVSLSILVQPSKLEFLAPFSMISNILSFTVISACFYYIFRDVDKIGFKDKKACGEAMRFPSYLSTVIFVMEGIGMVMPVENKMKEPSRFLGYRGILNNSMAIVSSLYMLLGFFGYLRYGKDVEPSITLNLPMDEWPAFIAKFSIKLIIIFSYPVHFFGLYKVAAKCIKGKLHPKHLKVQHAVIKILIVCISGAVAISIPMLEQVIGLVGSLLYSMLGLIIPASVDLVYHAQDYGEYNLIFWKDLLLLLFGIFVFFSGTSAAMNDIYDHYNNMIMDE